MGEITTGSGEILKSSKSKKINIWNVSDLKAVCYSLSEKYSHGQILIHYFKSDQVHLTTVSSRMLALHIYNEISTRK